MKIRLIASAIIAAVLSTCAHAASIVVKDANGSNQTVGALPFLGQALMINSLPFTLASDQPAVHVICDSGCAGSGGGSSSAITTWGGGTLGAMANYGTSPGSVLVPGVNAFITNTVGVTGTFWQATQPVSAASLPLPTGAATAANQASQLTQETATAAALGVTTDAAYAGSGSASAIAVLKGIYTAANTPYGAGSTGSSVPASAVFQGVNSGGNLTGLIQADSSAPINVSTATTTQLVALSAGKKIYVSSFDVVAGGTGNLTFVYGTGTNCGTGTTSLTGAYPLAAQATHGKGTGLGVVLVVPAGNALCVTTSAAVQMSGSVSYTQF